ncbi:MAG: PAS domain S-box protein [Thiovulaceae bacterium]|nr:PAS domain S-box protein [Sulfurimonadaceae bacterium]
MIQSNKNIDKKVSFIFMAFAVILIFSFISLEKLFLGNQAKAVSLDNAVKKTKEREEFFKNFLDRANTTLITVRESATFNDFLNGKRSDTDDLFMILAKSNPSLMKLRYIDKNGLEKLRINRNKEGSKPFFIAQNNLQDKSNRDFFLDAKSKPLEKVFFSAIDMNIEHDQIEIPYKPTLRAVLPVSRNGKLDGILIINYFMEGFLERFVDAPLYDMILADAKGNTLIHYDHSKNWGLYQKNRYKIDKDFPKNFEMILSNQLLIKDNFVSRRLNLPIENGLILIVQLKQQYLQDTARQQLYLYILIIVLVMLLAILASILLSLNIGKLYNELNKKLESSQKKFFTLFKESLDPIVIVDLPTQKFVEFNQKALDFYGYTKEEFFNLRIIDLEAIYDEEGIKKHQEKLLKKGWDKFVTKHKAKDGTLKDIIVNVVIISLDGKIYLYGTFHDITQEKEYEENLQRLINQQEALMQIKTTGFVHLKERQFVWTNDRFEEILGYDKGELQGENARLIYINDEEYEKYGKEAYEALSQSGTYSGEVRGVKKDGTPLILLASLTKLNDNEALGVLIDITKEKEQQILIENQKEELEAIFNLSKDGIAILDLETNFLEFNDAYLEMTGFSREELLMKSCLGLTAPEDYEYALEVAEQLKQEGYIKSFTKTCIAKNGKRVVVNMSSALMPDNKRIVLTAKDITEMKQHEKQLEFIAHNDALTGLPNRILNADRLNQAILRVQRNGGYVAVVYIDLDGFKEVNDTHGHDIGDQVLIEVAMRMKRALRGGDTLSRLGGDEFVAIIVDMDDTSVALPILKRLLKSARESIVLGDLHLHVSASIGVTFYPQKSEINGDQLITEADGAMYIAKQSGKNRYHIFA